MIRRLFALGLAGALGLAVGPVSAAEIVLKAAHTNAAGEPQDEGLKYLSKKLEEMTKGKAALQVFPNGQLGNEVQAIEGVLTGSIDMTVPANAPLTNFVPEMKIFDMPFLFRDYAHLDKVAQGPVFDEVAKATLAKGVRLLAIYSSGNRHIMTRDPINGIADLKGRKIRTMQNPVHLEAFKAFGANATPLAYNELYGALQTGVVDGAEAANTNYSAMKFYEVAKNWAMVSWISLTANVIMSEKKFQALPADVQQALIQAGKESAVYERKVIVDTEMPLLEQIKKSGAKITTPDPKPFQDASKPVYDKFLTSELDKKLLKMILDTK